ncbi:MAG: hypothetical protein IPN33_25645 [Saprospiraceae bacterium]|nr:hypothetical protein [Saprospiraceae bacterium]
MPGDYGHRNCSISRNKVGQGATIGGNISLSNGCEIVDNFLQSSAFIQDIEALDVSYIQNNAIGQNAGIYNIVFTGVNGEIKENEISVNIGFGNKTIGENVVISANRIGLDFSGTQVFADDFFIDARTIISGLSNASIELDITALTTLDCLSENNYVGIFGLTSSNATESIDTITNPPTLFPFTIRPAAGLVLTITGTAYSGIAAGQIALKATDYTLDGDKGEYIVLEIAPLGTGALMKKQVVNGLI